jgi:uncharacterized membrane protein SpoIIM required for sporulation
MNIQRWIARREPQWQQLDTILKKAETKGLKSLQTQEITNLASLYRSVSADLARAKTYQMGETITHDLQSLTSRAYSQIYQGSTKQEGQAIINFYLWELPAVIRETWLYTFLAFGIFLLGGLIAWWCSWRDPAFMSLVVPESLISKVRDQRELWMGSILGIEPAVSSEIMINNIAVCFRAIGGGITAGLFTLYILFFNGILIGAISTLVVENGLGFPFWGFVFPHGSLELPAIFLSGGAGFLIARGLLFPGQYRRMDALKIYGFKAAQLVFGIVPMLFVAGIIEAFISPQTYIPEIFKYLFGMLLFSLLLLYCSRSKI